MKRLLPVILAILGLAAGTGAGIFLKPAPSAKPAAIPSDSAKKTAGNQTGSTTEPQKPTRRSKGNSTEKKKGYEYVKLNNQFIVPVVKGASVTSLVVMSLNIEVEAGKKETVYGREPKLRDAFLQVLFDHANSGGFDGKFTSGEKMSDLRGSLYEAAVKVLGPIVSDVLVTDLVRQDI